LGVYVLVWHLMGSEPITHRQLAGLLRSHGVKPKPVRRGTDTEKGYKLGWFEDVFARYLRPRSVTASHVSDSTGFEPVRSVTLGHTAILM